MRTLLIIVSLLFFYCENTHSQDGIEIRNSSFEEFPRIGREGYVTIKHWKDCGYTRFPDESPPDIHPVPDSPFGVDLPALDGKTYVGLVVRFNESYESISQKLTVPMVAGKCYKLSFLLARAPFYQSMTMRSMGMHESFTKPAILKVWAGANKCSHKQLLGQTSPVEHEEWLRYDFYFRAENSFQYITFASAFDEKILHAYNGHVMLDGISSIVEVDCK